MTKSIILLSGGLDSFVSLGVANDKYNIKLALTFDYGQKSVEQEICASARICEYFGIEHKVVKLDWLKEITKTSLVSDENVPTGEELEDSVESMKKVWVPNRNGLFLNIAAAFADANDYDYIIIGANKEEAQTFSDNTQEFLDGVNVEFRYSTIKKPVVIAPLIKMHKNDIVKSALELELPLGMVRSCYQNTAKHCGICESCTRLKNALLANNDTHFINELFEK